MQNPILSIELLTLIVIGLIYQFILADNAIVNSLKTLIIKLFLPVLIFTAFANLADIHAFMLYPLFSIIFSFFLFIFFKILLKNTTAKNDYHTHIMMLSTFAPGLSVYPFIQAFMTRADLANAALLDFGEKLFIFIFIYFVCFYFLGRKVNIPKIKNIKKSQQTINILKNIVTEPVNIAIFFGVLFLLLQIKVQKISPAVATILMDIGDTTVLLVMLFIGLSLKKFKVIKGLQTILLLLMRAGLGLLFTAAFCYVTGITNRDVILILTAFTLGSVSFWPYVNMHYSNKLYQTDFYNDALALQFLTFSFPLTILLMFILFNLNITMIRSSDLFIIGGIVTITSLIAHFYLHARHTSND